MVLLPAYSMEIDVAVNYLYAFHRIWQDLIDKLAKVKHYMKIKKR